MGVYILGIEKRIIVLGERHGDSENPRRIRQVLKRVEEPYTFLIELDKKIRPKLEKYFENGSYEVLKDQHVVNNPGKLTKPMLELLKEIQENNTIKLLDPNIVEKEPDESIGYYNERRMAESIKSTSGKVIALLGETHANKKPIKSSDMPGAEALFKIYDDGVMRTAGYILGDQAHCIHLGPLHESQTYDEYIE